MTLTEVKQNIIDSFNSGRTDKNKLKEILYLLADYFDALPSISDQSKNTFRLRANDDPAEDFDRPDGTLLKNIKTVTGHEFHATGPEGATVQVRNNAMNSPGNVYTGLTSDEKVTRVSGVFFYSYLQYEHRPVLMFNGGPTDVSLEALIHLELGPYYWSLKLKDKDTVETELRPLLVPGVERHGKSDSVNYLTELIPGQKYFVAMEYARGATNLDDVLSVFLPDGRIVDYKGDWLIRSVMDKCYFGTWQLKGEASYWSLIALGESRARTILELGQGASKQRLIPLLNMSNKYRKNLNTTVVPTAPGWYKIADEISLHANITALCGTLRFFSDSASGQHVFAEIVINAFYNNTPTIKTVKRTFGTYGGIHISKVRLSTSPGSGDGNGEKQLEVYVNSFSNANARVMIEFDGTANLISNPVIGSEPLSIYREQNVFDTREGVVRQSIGSSKIFVPGIDPVKNILNTNYASAGLTHYLDNGKAQPDDEFYFVRSASFANNAILANLSDSSVIVTLSPGQTAYLGVDNGKFILLNKGSIV